MVYFKRAEFWHRTGWRMVQFGAIRSRLETLKNRELTLIAKHENAKQPHSGLDWKQNLKNRELTENIDTNLTSGGRLGWNE